MSNIDQFDKILLLVKQNASHTAAPDSDKIRTIHRIMDAVVILQVS